MKICIFNINAYSVFNPSSTAPIGGTEVQLSFLAEFFSEKFQTSFITGDWGQDKVEICRRIEIYKAFSLKKNVLNYLQAPFSLWRSLSDVNADVYIASSAGMEIGIIALFCKIYRKKFIYRTAHEWDCTGEYVSKHALLGPFFEYGLKYADGVVAQNLEHASFLKKNYGIIAEVIKNAWPVLLSKSVNKEDILWVGRCERWKNPDVFLKIVKQFPEYSFTMICVRTNMEFFVEMRRIAKEFQNITFIEGVPFSAVQAYFDKAKLFIGTSEYEGFPNTYLQACLGSTPIMSYKVNPDDFITKNNVGYCAGGDFETMINQIRRILQDKRDWEEKSKNAFKYVKENHDISIVGKQWTDLIYKILKK